MKKFIFSTFILTISLYSLAQVVEISKEQKIAKFNETAKQKATLYQNYWPKPSIYQISDEFKANHKYLYAWIQDDVLRIASDAVFYLCHSKILDVVTKKELCSIDHQYDNGGVFSDKFLLSELRAKMPGGTKGYYQLYYATKDRYDGRITFDQTHIVTSPNAAPVEKGPKLINISANFTTMDHDKEAGKWVDFKLTRKPRSVPDFYKYVVGGLYIEDPAKWDYSDKKIFNVDTKSKNVFVSDFANGGNLTLTNMPTDLWDVIIFIRLEFSDGSTKAFRARRTSNPARGSVWSIDFDKDFKVVKTYENNDF
ncbi:MAG: hypothetical protein IPH34_11355 [Chitinophagaceae bacterium]|nr:hypothetical protein [Chitinophagaceae bacterium]